MLYSATLFSFLIYYSCVCVCVHMMYASEHRKATAVCVGGGKGQLLGVDSLLTVGSRAQWSSGLLGNCFYPQLFHWLWFVLFCFVFVLF